MIYASRLIKAKKKLAVVPVVSYTRSRWVPEIIIEDNIQRWRVFSL